jgi:membrane protease YdiL (CAAX protease family)
LRTVGPPLLAVLAAVGFDRMAAARGLDPPGFRDPIRRILAGALLAGVFWVGIFAALGAPAGGEVAQDLQGTSMARLFLLHGVLVAVLGLWYLLGFAGFGAGARGGMGFPAQLGLRTPRPAREIGLGIAVGLCTWSALILCILAIAFVVSLVAGEDALPQKPPAAIVWIAALPILVRAALALTAGAVEEAFFRGLLQPRVGILLSTLLFAMAHLSYGQPFLLVGVTLLSLLYGVLTRMRQTIVPAMVAHAIFDGIQLLVVVPGVLKLFGGS